MTLSYNVGLTGGSLVAYLLDAMLGPPLAAPCKLTPPRFVTPRPNFVNTTASAVTVATRLATFASATVFVNTSQNLYSYGQSTSPFDMTGTNNSSSIP